MSNFEFYKAKEVYREKYFQMPKVFFTSEKYKDMSNDAKVAYTLLKDRFEYSVKNNWVDSDDNIYFIFTVAELMQLLNCREGKVSRIKKELESHQLLYQKRGGVKRVGNQKINLPNFLYLGKPEITSEDVFMMSEDDNINSYSGIAKIANPQKAQQINDFSGIAKIAIPQEVNNTNSSSGIAKIADYLFYSLPKDTLREPIDTEKESSSAIQDKILLESLNTLVQDHTFVPERVIDLIKIFSSDFSDAQKSIKTIHNAKAEAENRHGKKFIYEDVNSRYGIDVDTKLYNTLLKAYQKQKIEKVNNMHNLIYVYVTGMFTDIISEIKCVEENNLDL